MVAGLPKKRGARRNSMFRRGACLLLILCAVPLTAAQAEACGYVCAPGDGDAATRHPAPCGKQLTAYLLECPTDQRAQQELPEWAAADQDLDGIVAAWRDLEKRRQGQRQERQLGLNGAPGNSTDAKAPAADAAPKKAVSEFLDLSQPASASAATGPIGGKPWIGCASSLSAQAARSGAEGDLEGARYWDALSMDALTSSYQDQPCPLPFPERARAYADVPLERNDDPRRQAALLLSATRQMVNVLETARLEEARVRREFEKAEREAEDLMSTMVSSAFAAPAEEPGKSQALAQMEQDKQRLAILRTAYEQTRAPYIERIRAIARLEGLMDRHRRALETVWEEPSPAGAYFASWDDVLYGPWVAGEEDSAEGGQTP